jgi:SAM-dependent MidA family methyltransferase
MIEAARLISPLTAAILSAGAGSVTVADTPDMGSQARRAIGEAIRDHGPITFAEYMELALYGPGGFYERTPVGQVGDFVTSPHVHPIFGQLLASALLELWDGMGRPEPLRLTEVGAGDGTLARQLQEALAEVPLEYRAVERSRGAREALSTIARLEVLDELGGEPHLMLAHELLDNLPFRRFRGDAEVLVDLVGDRFVERCDIDADAAVEDTIVPEGALAFVDRLASVLTLGYALLIDYGDVGGTGGPLHGYRDHRVVEDLLADPGASDITSGVDFARIADRARERGLDVVGIASQHDVLVTLGFETWIRGELAAQAELLDQRRGREAVRAWSGRSRATLLVDPTALGRLRWMVLATPGLPRPSWLGP